MELGLDFDSEVCPSQHLHAQVCRHEHCHPCLYPIYTIQRVVKPVVQPSLTTVLNELSNRSNTRLYRVYKHLTV